MEKHPQTDRGIKSSFNQEVVRPPTLDQKISLLENKIRPLESTLPEKDRSAYAEIKVQGEQAEKALIGRQEKNRPTLFDGIYNSEFQRRQQEARRAPRPVSTLPPSPKAMAEASRKIADTQVAHQHSQERLRGKVITLERQHDFLKRAHSKDAPQQQAASKGREAFNKVARER